ncbi:uncharacterized protein LOC119368153 [Triticum dicoccoides]|uniref:uncharacterized protein LOC119368153 n=1 Tax=Triticum dicoccoides TaxID=85692 RepID=UPI00188EB64E|nr:uncharacterized protein LOC119368153 [Triticum dicoccoides]
MTDALSRAHMREEKEAGDAEKEALSSTKASVAQEHSETSILPDFLFDKDENVGIGVVAVAGKANPAQLCQWLKRKISKDVKIFRHCPHGLRIVISRASRVGLRCLPAATCVALGLHPR